MKYTTCAVWMESVLKEKDNCHDPYFDRNEHNVRRGVYSMRAKEDILVKGSSTFVKERITLPVLYQHELLLLPLRFL